MHRILRFAARGVAVVFVAAALGAGYLWHWLQAPLPLPSSPYAFDIKSGASLRTVARDLAAAGVLQSPTPLIALARLRNVDRTIKAGNYEVASGITLPQLLDKL